MVEMAFAHRSPIESPATHVRGGHRLHEGAQLAVAPRPQKQVPMIGRRCR